MRAWLNGNFFNAAFSLQERKSIVGTSITTPSYNSNSGGRDTQDKLWLLSYDEAKEWLTSGAEGRIKLTDYAKVNGDSRSSSKSGWWWLRSPGDDSMNFAKDCFTVEFDYDYIRYYMHYVARPAFLLDLESADI